MNTTWTDYMTKIDDHTAARLRAFMAAPLAAVLPAEPGWRAIVQVGQELRAWWARQPVDTRGEGEVRAIHEAREARGEAARVAYGAGDWQTFARLVQADVDDAAAEKAAGA